jgi:SAM-dependent methyltransferase
MSMVLIRESLGKARYKLHKLKLKGAASLGRFYCPVCDHRVNRFEPLAQHFLAEVEKYGFPYTVDEAETCNAAYYACPLCGAADRERLYALYLRDYFRQAQTARPLRLVDFAPSAPLSQFIRRALAETARPFSYRTADLLRADVDDRVDITAMDCYEASAFDFFICSHVLEHVPDDGRALAELYRILRPGGRGILVVPIVLTVTEIDEDPSVTDPAERWRRFGQDDHVRLYSKQGFLARVEAAGFVVHQLGREHFGAETFRKHGISEQSVLYVVEKA